MLMSKTSRGRRNRMNLSIDNQSIVLVTLGYAYEPGTTNELGFNPIGGLFWEFRPNKQLISAMLRLRYMHESES